MMYHAQTHTCIILIKQKKSYKEAEQYCNTKYTGGHLVYIFDNETDTFVRALLTKNMIAFIGLKFKSGAYKWGDRKLEVTYSGWKSSPSNSGRDYAAITRTGWTEVSHSSYFVCQQTCGPAILCDGSVDVPTFPVSSRLQVIKIKLCVWVFPKPITLWLKKAFGDYSYIDSRLYTRNFSYRDSRTAQGEIELTIFRNHRLQFGKYNLVVDNSPCYNLTFEIKGPPECPSRFKAEALDHSSVQLTWIPGNDGGTQQMFIVMMTKMSGDFVMARVEDGHVTQMVHILSNLSEATKYTFYIDVNNTQGLTRCRHINSNVVTKERGIFLLNEKKFLNTTHVLKKDSNMSIKCQVSDGPVDSLELLHDKGDKQLETLIRKDNASILSYTSQVQCNSSGRYVCQVTNRSEVITKQGYIRSECDAKYCNEKTNQTPSFELLYRNETCTVILCLWIYPLPSSFRLYKANEEIEASNYNITFNYLTSYTTKGHLTLTLFQRYNFTPGPYHVTAYSTKQRSSNIEFELTVHIAKKVESHNNTNLVSYIIIVVSVNVIIISVLVAVIVIKLKRNSSKQEVSMTTENIYNNISESEEISVNQRPGHFERWSLRSTVIADEEPKASTQISDSANSAELTPRTDAKDEASDSRMTGEAEQTYANVTCIADGQRREQVLTKDPGQGCRMNTQEKSRMSSAGNNKRIMTSHSDRQRTSNYDVGHTLGPEGDGRTLGSEGDKRTLDSEGDGRILGPEGDGRTLGSVGDGRTLGSVGDGHTLGSKGDGRTLGSEGDKRTLGSEGDGRTLGSEGDWRSLESEGRKLSPDNIRTSMIRKHSKRTSGRKSKSLRTSVKVNKYKDDHESCIIKNNSGIEGLTLDSKHEEQTDDSKDKGHTFATENDGKTADSVYKGHAIPSENKEYSMDSEYKGYKFASENDERTLNSEYKGRTLVSENDDQTIDSGYKWHTFASEDEGQTVDSDDKGQIVDPDDEGRRVTPRDKGHTVDFKNNDLTVNLKDESLTVISDSTNDGRTISPEGLVYVSVIINPDTKKPEVTATRQSKAPYESVEYASINYSATLEAKVDDEKE
uniref:C-type lectin domain-containing protein n=1 Tax=Biomphalaria glabrata TaxID=6526 RepID=A0A2C9M9I7_BIOGL